MAEDVSAIPKVGERYVSTDQAGASEALGLPLVVDPLIFVTVSNVYPEHEKVRVSDGELWLSFDNLRRFFRLRGAAGSHSQPK